MKAYSLIGKASFLLVAMAVVICVADDSTSQEKKKDVPKIFDYGEYVEKFRKSYSPVETLNKARLFFGRTLKIFHHNVQYKTNSQSYYLGQNRFTDMTAEELKKLRNNQQDGEMRLVDEAKENPDLPASSSVVATRFAQVDEAESSANLEELQAAAQRIPKIKPIVDFMDDDSTDMVGDLRKVLNRIKSQPKLAEHIEKVIETSKNNQIKNLDIEKVAEANKISINPIPKSNNKNYDMESIVSYGSGREVYEEFARNYAQFLMEDPDFFGLNLQPYDKPKDNEKKPNKDKDNDDELVPSPLDALIGSMKSIYDFFTLDGYDESLDQDVAPTSVVKPKSKDTITYNIDWRKTGCITKPKDQKDCNSCYAFATLGLMEYFHCKQTKQLTDFGAQVIVDCGHKSNLHGCQGGKLSNVGQFIRRYGIELDNTYPYTAREGQCSIEDDKPEKAGYLRPHITAWQSFPSIGAWYKWLPKSPIIVGISMPSDFFGYAGGIHDGASCDENSVHALLLVGSGKQGDQEFWLMKNSFSSEFGEDGYFRLSKAAPMRCFHSAVVARPKFVGV